MQKVGTFLMMKLPALTLRDSAANDMIELIRWSPELLPACCR